MSCRARVACLLCAFMFGSVAAVSAQTGERVVPSPRVTTFVHIRAAPDAESAERGRLQIGQSLALVQSVPRWYEVELPGGGRGFVSKAWTTVTHPLQARAENELRIHFLNIGTGSCALVECPGANAPRMIVDCGSLGATPNDMTAAQARAYIQNSLGASTDVAFLGFCGICSSVGQRVAAWCPASGRPLLNRSTRHPSTPPRPCAM